MKKSQDYFEYEGKDVLDVMATCAVNRNNLIESLIKKYFHLEKLKDKKNILEFGAGNGLFIDRFKAAQLNLNTFAVELDNSYYLHLAKSHSTYKTINDIDFNIDFVYSIDVLEHIHDDACALKDIYDKLNTQGLLFLYVPARSELYGTFDKKIGHIRRYHLSGLKQTVKKAGFKIIEIKYHDFLGYFAAIYNKFTSKGGLNPKGVLIYDKYLMPVTKRLEAIVTPPIGKNIILLAKKE